MAKTQEELNALKEEVETLNKKLAELTDEELAQVTGGTSVFDLIDAYCGRCPICNGILHGLLDCSTNIVWSIACEQGDYDNNEGIPLSDLKTRFKQCPN